MINLKTELEIQIMREGGKILHTILGELALFAKEGMETKEFNKRAIELIASHDGARASFLGYREFPAVICTSINYELVHGVPSERILKAGDLLKLDLGVFYKGFHTDSAVTVLVGDNLDKKKYAVQLKLMDATREALEKGIEAVKIGNTFGDIGAAVQKTVEGYGFNVSRELVGHGIGRKLHENPYVLNYGKPGEGEELKEGMVIAIEPITMVGKWQMEEGPDGFAYITKDRSLSAHFEHTLAITKKGPEVLT